MKLLINLQCLILISMLPMSVFAVEIYKCTQQNNTIFQDKPCTANFNQEVLNYDISAPNPNAGLRPLELSYLNHFLNRDNIKLRANLELRNDFRLQQQYHDNAIAYEELRHEQAIEMFDKHYRHFWVYGYANGTGSFPITWAPNSTTQTVTNSGDTSTTSP